MKGAVRWLFMLTSTLVASYEMALSRAGFHADPSTRTLLGTSSLECEVTIRNTTGITIPSSFDARNKWPGCISPILDQGRCGSCWAFATAQVLSDRLCILGRATGRPNKRLLSPQHLVACDHGCVNPIQNLGCDLGCNGGSLDAPWEYTRTNGLVGLSCLPYTAGNGQPSATCPSSNAEGNLVCTTRTLYTNTAFKSSKCYQILTVAQIQIEIMSYGSVVAGMMAYQDFSSYRSGVYVVGADVPQNGGHAVRIIGWGNTKKLGPYWILANQWSVNWGIQGYGYIRRGSNEAFIESIIIAAPALLPEENEYESYEIALRVNQGNHLLPFLHYPFLSLLFMYLVSI